MTWILAMALASSVPFTSIARGDMSQVETARQAVVRTRSEWSALWKDHSPGQTPPALDFATRMVVGVFLGTMPTTGYAVKIVGVKTDGETLIVEYAQRQPARGAIAAQMLTQPFHLVAVPTHDGPVRFVRVENPASPAPEK